MAEKIPTQALKGRRSIDFMTIPELKSARDIISKKLNKTNDPILHDKLQDMMNDYTKKERAINKFYQKCLTSKNRNLASMMRGKRLLLKFVDIKKIDKHGNLKDKTFKSKAEKWDYNAFDFLRDVKADKIAFGLGVSAVAFGALSLDLGKGSLLTMILNALKEVITANPIAFSFLAGGASLIAASKIIPAISKTARRVKNHVSSIREVQNEIAEERFKDESGFDNTYLSQKNFDANKEKIVNDLFNHPALLVHYKNELSNPNSTLSVSQKMNLIKAFKEVSVKLDDFERIRQGKPTIAEEKKINEQKENDNASHSQAMQSLNEIKNDLFAMEDMKSIENIDSKIKSIESNISKISDTNLSNELTTELSKFKTDFENKKSKVVETLKENENAKVSNLLTEIENTKKTISGFTAETPVADIDNVKSKLNNIQSQVDSMTFDENKSKLQPLIAEVQKQYEKVAPKQVKNEPAPEKNEVDEKDINITYEFETKNEILKDAEEVEKSINNLSINSTTQDINAISEEIEKIKSKMSNLNDKEYLNEVQPKVDEVIGKFNQVREENQKHKAEIEELDNLEKEITEELDDLANETADLSNEPPILIDTPSTRDKFIKIEKKINSIKNPDYKNRLKNAFDIEFDKFNQKSNLITSEQSNIQMLTNDIEYCEKNINSLDFNNYLNIAKKIEDIESKVYATKDSKLIERFTKVDNDYIVKKNNLKNKIHGEDIEATNKKLSDLRIKIANITEENFKQLSPEIDKELKEVKENILNITSTRTHFEVRYQNIVEDYKNEVVRQNRKLNNKKIHEQIGSEVEPEVVDALDGTLSIEEFETKYAILKEKINVIKETIDKTEKENHNFATNSETIKEIEKNLEGLKVVSKTIEVDKVTTKQVANRISDLESKLESAKQQYEKIKAQDEIDLKTIETHLNRITETSKQINYSNEKEVEDLANKYVVLRDFIDSKLAKSPSLSSAIKTKFAESKNYFEIKAGKNNTINSNPDAKQISNEISNLTNEIDGLTTLKSLNTMQSEFKSLKAKVNKLDISELYTLYNESSTKLNKKANELYSNSKSKTIKSINEKIQQTHSAIGSMKSSEDAIEISKMIVETKDEVKNMPFGEEVFGERVAGLSVYLSKRSAKISAINYENNIRTYLDKMDSMISRLNEYNYEQHSKEMETDIKLVDEIINSTNVREGVKTRYALIKENYNKKSENVKVKVDENIKNNKSYIKEVDEIYKTAKITSNTISTKLKDNISKSNINEIEYKLSQFSQNSTQIYEKFKNICSKKEDKDYVYNIWKEISDEVTKYSNALQERKTILNNQTQFDNYVNRLESDIINIKEPTAQNFDKLQEKINNLSKWKNIDSQVIKEATEKTQETLNNVKAQIKESEKIQEALNNEISQGSEIDKKFALLTDIYNKSNEKCIYKQLQDNGVCKNLTSYKIEINGFLNLLESQKDNLPTEKYNEYLSKSKSMGDELKSKEEQIKQKVTFDKDKFRISTRINTVNKVLNSEITFEDFKKSKYGFEESLNIAEDLANKHNLKDSISEIENTRAKLLEIERKLREQSQTKDTFSYENQYKTSINNIIEQEGSRSARIKKQQEKDFNKNALKSHLQRILFITDAEAEKFFDPTTGKLNIDEGRKKYIDFESPDVKTLLDNYKNSLKEYNTLSTEEEQLNIKTMDSNVSNIKTRIVNRIVKITKMEESTVDKLVTNDGKITGELASNEKVLNDKQIVNLTKKINENSAVLNRYKSADRAGRQKMASEVVLITTKEINRLKRNMTSNLGIDEANKIFNKTYEELNIEAHEIDELIETKISPNEEVLVEDAPATGTKEPTKEEIEKSKKAIEEFHSEIKKTDKVVKKASNLEQYKTELQELYSIYQKDKSPDSKKNYTDLINKIKEECPEVSLDEIIPNAKDERKIKNKELSAKDSVKTMEELTTKFNKILENFKDTINNKNPNGVDSYANSIIKSYDNYIHLKSAEYDAYRENLTKQIEECKENYKNNVQNSEVDKSNEELKIKIVNENDEVIKTRDESLITEEKNYFKQKDKSKTQTTEVTSIESSKPDPLASNIKFINELLDEYKKEREKYGTASYSEKHQSKNNLKEQKESIKELISQFKKEHPDQNFDFEKDDIYNEIMVDKKDISVTNIKQALNGLDTDSLEFLNFIKTYKRLYEELKTNPTSKPFVEIEKKLAVNARKLSLNDNQLYVAKELVKTAYIAAEKTSQAGKTANNSVNMDKALIEELYNKGVTKPEQIEKITKLNSTFVKNAVKEIEKLKQKNGELAIELGG